MGTVRACNHQWPAYADTHLPTTKVLLRPHVAAGLLLTGWSVPQCLNSMFEMMIGANRANVRCT